MSKKSLCTIRKKLNSITILIKVVIKLNYKISKLAIKTCYNKVNSKVKLYYKYASLYNGQI